MSEDDRIESDRLKRLEENRESWAENGINLDERFGPGSFGCHEAMHVADIFAGLVEDRLCNHSAVLRDPHWYKLACTARDSLAWLYCDMGAVHLDADDPGKSADQSEKTGETPYAVWLRRSGKLN